MAMPGRTFNSQESQYGFNGKRKDDEIYGSGNAYDFGARIYDPRLARFLSIDPRWKDYAFMTPYCFAANSPIRFVDIDGEGVGDPVGPGYYGASQTSREIGFAVRHPIYATQIGVVTHNSLNISTNAARFAVNSNLPENRAMEGSHLNAFRHTLWQATITKEFGANIAKEVGNAHEANPFADISKRTFSGDNALSQADETIDLLNNSIGRELGGKYKNLSAKDLALKTLDYFKENGLYTADKQKDGSYKVGQTKLTDEQYKTAYERISKSDNEGFTKTQRQGRDNEVKAETAKAGVPVKVD